MIKFKILFPAESGAGELLLGEASKQDVQSASQNGH